MRKFINGNGADVTQATVAHLSTGAEFVLPDLYVISTGPSFVGNQMGRTFLLTDYAAPLWWGYRGYFTTAKAISRSPVESKIGHEASKLEVNWAPSDSDIVASNGSSTLLTVMQSFRYGIFDNGPLEVWRGVLDSRGTLDTYGATLLFKGRIGDVKPDRVRGKISAINLLETLNQHVPTNLVEPTNVFAQYAGGIVPPDGPSSLTVAVGSGLDKIYAATTLADGFFDGGFLMFSSGLLAGYSAKVRRQAMEGGNAAFYLYRRLPFEAAVGDTAVGFIPVPRDYASGSTLKAYAGFPFVPAPTNTGFML